MLEPQLRRPRPRGQALLRTPKEAQARRVPGTQHMAHSSRGVQPAGECCLWSGGPVRGRGEDMRPGLWRTSLRLGRAWSGAKHVL